MLMTLLLCLVTVVFSQDTTYDDDNDCQFQLVSHGLNLTCFGKYLALRHDVDHLLQQQGALVLEDRHSFSQGKLEDELSKEFKMLADHVDTLELRGNNFTEQYHREKKESEQKLMDLLTNLTTNHETEVHCQSLIINITHQYLQQRHEARNLKTHLINRASQHEKEIKTLISGLMQNLTDGYERESKEHLLTQQMQIEAMQSFQYILHNQTIQHEKESKSRLSELIGNVTEGYESENKQLQQKLQQQAIAMRDFQNLLNQSAQHEKEINSLQSELVWNLTHHDQKEKELIEETEWLHEAVIHLQNQVNNQIDPQLKDLHYLHSNITNYLKRNKDELLEDFSQQQIAIGNLQEQVNNQDNQHITLIQSFQSELKRNLTHHIQKENVYQIENIKQQDAALQSLKDHVGNQTTQLDRNITFVHSELKRLADHLNSEREEHLQESKEQQTAVKNLLNSQNNETLQHKKEVQAFCSELKSNLTEYYEGENNKVLQESKKHYLAMQNMQVQFTNQTIQLDNEISNFQSSLTKLEDHHNKTLDNMKNQFRKELEKQLELHRNLTHHIQNENVYQIENIKQQDAALQSLKDHVGNQTTQLDRNITFVHSELKKLADHLNSEMEEHLQESKEQQTAVKNLLNSQNNETLQHKKEVQAFCSELKSNLTEYYEGENNKALQESKKHYLAMQNVQVQFTNETIQLDKEIANFQSSLTKLEDHHNKTLDYMQNQFRKELEKHKRHIDTLTILNRNLTEEIVQNQIKNISELYERKFQQLFLQLTQQGTSITSLNGIMANFTRYDKNQIWTMPFEIDEERRQRERNDSAIRTEVNAIKNGNLSITCIFCILKGL